MICPNCGATHALSDNFCRRCGWNVSGAQVPAVIDTKRSIAPFQPEQALAIGGAATVAVGALAWLAKRWLARRVTAALANQAPQPQPPARRAAADANAADDAQVESFVWIRRITLRR